MMETPRGERAIDFHRRPYYLDQVSRMELDGYFNKLVQYIGPTPGQLAHPASRSARIQANRAGQRDVELAVMEPARMTPAARASFAQHLVDTGRLRMVIEKLFPPGGTRRPVARPEETS